MLASVCIPGGEQWRNRDTRRLALRSLRNDPEKLCISDHDCESFAHQCGSKRHRMFERCDAQQMQLR